MRKWAVCLCIAATVAMSGAAGYFGTMYANWQYGELRTQIGAKTAADGYEIADMTDYGAQDTMTFFTDEAGVPVAERSTDSGPEDGAFEFSLSDYGTFSLNAGSSLTDKRVLTIPEIVAAVSDSVVEIATETVVSSSRMGQYVTSGAGSGVIVSANGYIVTNNHVIAGASKITVRLRNGQTFAGTLVGRDAKTDLAVIKIEATGLTVAVYGDSERLLVGELAVAIGNPLGQLGGTVTEGIISALDRDIEIDGEKMNLLQTSAAVNPGNSGGGLFNAYGELVGIVNAKSSGSGNEVIEGLGFAIPSDTVRTVADALIRYGYLPGRIHFDIALVDITDAFTAMYYRLSSLGVYVARDDAESGLKSGDRVISVNGKAVSSVAEVKAVYEQYTVGDVLDVVVERGGKQYAYSVVLKQAKD